MGRAGASFYRFRGKWLRNIKDNARHAARNKQWGGLEDIYVFLLRNRGVATVNPRPAALPTPRLPFPFGEIAHIDISKKPSPRKRYISVFYPTGRLVTCSIAKGICYIAPVFHLAVGFYSEKSAWVGGGVGG